MFRALSWSLCLGLALLSRPLGAQPAGAGESRTALVIGNSAYPESPLRNTLNDARGMARVLRDRGFEVAELENATQQTMEEAIRTFRSRLGEGRGVGLFFFAGHGVSVGGRNYLLPVGQVFQSESDVRYKATEAGYVLGAMEDAGARVSLVILDACRNNPFGSRSLFRSASRGLAVIEAPRGSLVAFATAPGSTAADGDGSNGLYTGELIKAIREMPEVEVEQLLKRVSARVQADSGGSQVPYRSSSLTGEFFFGSKVGGAPAVTSPPMPALGQAPTMPVLLGGLQVGVNAPEAKVYVDGELKGTASPTRALDLRDLPVGTVTVRAEAPGHRPREETVEIRQGQWTQARLVLARMAGSVNEPRPEPGPFKVVAACAFSGAAGGQLAVDPARGRVYISGGMGQQGLVRVDVSRLPAISQRPLSYGGGVAVDRNTGRYATTDGYKGKLYVFNADDTPYDSTALSGCGGDLDADPGSGRFFISTQCSDHLAVYDPGKRALLADIGVPGVGSRVLVDPGTGNIFENLTPNHQRGGVAPLVVAGGGFRTSMPFNGFVQAVDERLQHLYVTDNNGRVIVLDSSSFVTLGSLSGPACSLVIADTALGRFYTVSGNDTLTTYDGTTFARLGSFTLPAPPSNLRMAPGDSRLYEVSGNQLYVIQR